MPTFRAAIFGSMLAALAAVVLVTAYVLPNLASGIDAFFHWFGASTIRGWGAALSVDPDLVAKLAEGVYGEARFALILLTLVILFVYCFLRPSITKLDTKHWFLMALVLLLVIYTAIDILSLKAPHPIQAWIDASGFVLARLLFVLSNLQAGPVTITSFGSMLVVFQMLCGWLIITWFFRRK